MNCPYGSRRRSVNTLFAPVDNSSPPMGWCVMRLAGADGFHGQEVAVDLRHPDSNARASEKSNRNLPQLAELGSAVVAHASRQKRQVDPAIAFKLPHVLRVVAEKDVE